MQPIPDSYLRFEMYGQGGLRNRLMERNKYQTTLHAPLGPLSIIYLFRIRINPGANRLCRLRKGNFAFRLSFTVWVVSGQGRGKIESFHGRIDSLSDGISGVSHVLIVKFKLDRLCMSV